ATPLGLILPRPRPTPHPRLTPPLALPSTPLFQSRYFRGKAVQLVHHRVDGALQLQSLPAHVYRDLLRQVALGDRGSHLGDVAHLVGGADGCSLVAVGEILPCAPRARNPRLAAQLA